jgi:hypothetical protein
MGTNLRSPVRLAPAVAGSNAARRSGGFRGAALGERTPGATCAARREWHGHCRSARVLRVAEPLQSSWAMSGRVDLDTFPWLPLVLVLAPLGVFALFAYRLPAVSFNEITVRVWPVAAIGIYGLISVTHVGTYPLHALQGLSIPFAVLAVIGVSHLRLQLPSVLSLLVGALVVALLVVPPVVREFQSAQYIGFPLFGTSAPVFVTSSEQAALRYLESSPLPGAVLAPVYLGQTVPGETGRQTWVGLYSWTPDYPRRVVSADNLFSGRMPREQAIALVRSSRARFLLSDCDRNADLKRILASVVTSERRFGCATVYTVTNTVTNVQMRQTHMFHAATRPS